MRLNRRTLMSQFDRSPFETDSASICHGQRGSSIDIIHVESYSASPSSQGQRSIPVLRGAVDVATIFTMMSPTPLHSPARYTLSEQDICAGGAISFVPFSREDDKEGFAIGQRIVIGRRPNRTCGSSASWRNISEMG